MGAGSALLLCCLAGCSALSSARAGARALAPAALGIGPTHARHPLKCTATDLSSETELNATAEASSFNRFARSLGDAFAYTAGDLSSGLMTLGRGIGKYIPNSVPLPVEAGSLIAPVSSFKNLSEHSLVGTTEPEYLPSTAPQEDLAPPDQPRRRSWLGWLRSLLPFRRGAPPRAESAVASRGVLGGVRQRLGLFLRRRLLNLVEKTNPSWARARAGDDTTTAFKTSLESRRRAAAPPRSALSELASLLPRMGASDRAEEVDEFDLFVSERPGLLEGARRALGYARDAWAGLSADRRDRVDGYMSDGRSLVAFSVVQVLSTVPQLSFKDLTAAGSSLFRSAVGGRSLVVFNAPADMPLEQFRDEPSSTIIDAEPVLPAAAAPLIPGVDRGNSFSPLLSFFARRLLHAPKEPMEGGVLNVVPVVRLLPRITDLVFPSPPPPPAPAPPPRPFVGAVDSRDQFRMSEQRDVLASARSWSAASTLPAEAAKPSDPPLPRPSRTDLSHVRSSRVEAAVQAALCIDSYEAFLEFATQVGLKPLLSALVRPPPAKKHLSVDAVVGLNIVVGYDARLIPTLLAKSNFLDALNDMLEEPLGYGFGMFRSAEEREARQRAQLEAVRLLFRLVRASDAAIAAVRANARTVSLISRIRQTGEDVPDDLDTLAAGDLARIVRRPAGGPVFKLSNTTVVVDYPQWKPYEMARVIGWALGGVDWKPAQRGQRGLRILSLDGGGTRGVLSISILKELLRRVGNGRRPFEMFDVICGTSTGGIIAVLLGAQRMDMDSVELLYESLIGKIFGQRFESKGIVSGTMQLLTEKAVYDASAWELILKNMCGDELLVDSNRHVCPRVICVSSNVSSTPQRTQLWTNYNLPPDASSGTPSAWRVNTAKAVRMTSAAPTFFKPVKFNDFEYVDGAITANNPTDIAIREAKVRRDS